MTDYDNREKKQTKYTKQQSKSISISKVVNPCDL